MDKVYREIDIDNDLLEVKLADDEAFLKIKETLTRIGIASRQTQTLHQSCHIFHKRGRYFITHFKEMFALDGRPTNIDEYDILRRNAIANLLSEWGLLTILNEENYELDDLQSKVKLTILPYKEKKNWNLESKYTVGRKKD